MGQIEDKLDSKKNKDSQTNLFRNDENREIVDKLLERYNIRIPLHDPSKRIITYRNEENSQFAPSFGSMWLYLRSEKLRVSKDVLRTILECPEYISPYDPVKEYFDSIRKKYKGESQIELFTRHITPRCFDEHTPEYYRQRTDRLIKKWLVACVACWIGGTPNDVALGFIHSREGIGKTHLTEFIVPEVLKDYYVKSSKDDRKFDIEDVFTRYMIINFDELNGINPRSIDTFKACMSDREILNKRRNEEFPTKKDRIGCAMLTSNRNQELGGFLHESYGYRRFGLIELENIDREYSNKVDVDQLWAEALMLYEETDFNSKFEEEDYNDFAEYNRRFMAETSAMKFLQMYIASPGEDNPGEKMSTTEIYERLKRKIRKEDQDKITVRSLGIALKALGYEKKSTRDDPGNLKKYTVIIKE